MEIEEMEALLDTAVVEIRKPLRRHKPIPPDVF
jgi:hypothetical protein